MPPRKQNRTTEQPVIHSQNGDTLISARSAAMRDADMRHGTMRVDAHPADARNGSEPSHDQIAQIAYDLWVARGRRHGADWQDWHDAELRLGLDSSERQRRA